MNASLEVADASRGTQVGAIASRQAGEYDILHRGLQRRRQADNVAVAIASLRRNSGM